MGVTGRVLQAPRTEGDMGRDEQTDVGRNTSNPVTPRAGEPEASDDRATEHGVAPDAADAAGTGREVPLVTRDALDFAEIEGQSER